MNEKLIVKNFGPIKDAELDLKKVTVFIGPQGSGKSTLAKLVAICKDKSFLADSHLGKPNLSYFEKYQAQYFINSDTDVEFVTPKYSFNYKPTENNFLLKDSSEMTGELFGRLQATSFHPTFESTKNGYKGYLEIQKRGYGNYRVIYPTVESIVREMIEQLTSKTKYLPTDRLLISSISDSILGLLSAEVALQKSTVSFGGDFEIARLKIPTLFIGYLNITYKYENGRNLVFHNETDSVPLSASASGHQSTIPLHLTVEHFAKEESTHFIVEEPELNLFPTTQKQLVGYLADKCTKKDNELLMTTHSPYVLSSLNNLLFAYQVANKYPEMSDEIATIIPREQWINPDDFEAYYVGENENGEKGGIRSIFNKKTGLIGENELDAISEDLGGEFDALMNIYRTKKRETVN
ncbi:putative ATPase [Arcicella aurantiaca]|uniref:Putative ATPase n=1 Tax=Arcicella aurantiaca TaxID=591202 RepID=A0A316EEZ8_9BACT|nr:AAA family ATPase [Arcicella aurantiaca]PWK28650.1 putative ATPase [Arcicella aurantiaca]